MISKSPKETNEKQNLGLLWEILFKINLVLLPLILAWGIWVTSNIFTITGWIESRGARFTTSDARTMHVEIIDELKNWVTINYVARPEITKTEINITNLQREIIDLRKEAVALNSQIAKELEAIRIQLAKMEKNM